MDTNRAEVQAAIRNRLDEMGRSFAWLGAEVARLEGRTDPYGQTAVSAWLGTHKGLNPAQMFAIEHALQLRPGSLSRQLGYLPVTARSTHTVRDAVNNDPRLGDRARRLILTVYNELADQQPLDNP